MWWRLCETLPSQVTTLSSSLSPIKDVGWNASDKKWANGNQYQNCVNTSKPTTAVISVWPFRVCSDNDMLRPPAIFFSQTEQFCRKKIKNKAELDPIKTSILPASKIPCAMMAPYFAMTSSCLSVIIFMRVSRSVFTLGHVASVCCMQTRLMATRTPCRT